MMSIGWPSAHTVSLVTVASPSRTRPASRSPAKPWVARTASVTPPRLSAIILSACHSSCVMRGPLPTRHPPSIGYEPTGCNIEKKPEFRAQHRNCPASQRCERRGSHWHVRRIASIEDDVLAKLRENEKYPSQALLAGIEQVM